MTKMKFLSLRAATRGGVVLLVGLTPGACMPASPPIQAEQPWFVDPYPPGVIPTGTVVGRVIDGATGQGLAGVHIQVQNVQPAVVATSDEAGAFTLLQVPQGKQILVAKKAGFDAPPGPLIADVMPRATYTLAAFAMRSVVSVPSPTPTPRQWFRARFLGVRGVNADTSAFDTERRDGEGDVQVNGGVFVMWREESNYSKPHPRAFTIEARWAVGMAPPPSKDRALEFRFAVPPMAGQHFTLGTGTVSATSAELRYLQGYRFRRDVWAATGGSLVVSSAEGGTVKIVISDATLAPDPGGEDIQSEATGTFELTGEGVVLPQDQRSQAPPDPTPTPSPDGPGMFVGSRQVGASVAEGGRGSLPVELARARFEAPPPEGCP